MLKPSLYSIDYLKGTMILYSYHTFQRSKWTTRGGGEESGRAKTGFLRNTMNWSISNKTLGNDSSPLKCLLPSWIALPSLRCLHALVYMNRRVLLVHSECKRIQRSVINLIFRWAVDIVPLSANKALRSHWSLISGWPFVVCCLGASILNVDCN